MEKDKFFAKRDKGLSKILKKTPSSFLGSDLNFYKGGIMLKEIIVVLIFAGNALTGNYTKASVEETTNNLQELRTEMMKEDYEVNSEECIKKIDKIHEMWDVRYEKLAYYIEHNELEKVETELTGLRGYVDKEEYVEAVAGLDRSIYILEHIKDKLAFNLKNVF